MSRRYTKAELAFIAKAYRRMGMQDVTDALNQKFGTAFTVKQIRATCKNHGFTCGRGKGDLNKGKLRSFTTEQHQWIKRAYKRLSLAELTTAFNAEFNQSKTQAQIRAFTRNHNIKSGRTGYFPKGQKSWNSGTKGVMKPNRTSFTKGQIPPNLRPLGAERISVDGYVEVKVAEHNPHTGAATRFRPKHQLVWERTYGPIPKGMIITFKDGNPINCQLNNLELMSRGRHVILNKLQYRTLPEPLKPSARLLADVYEARHQRKEAHA